MGTIVAVALFSAGVASFLLVDRDVRFPGLRRSQAARADKAASTDQAAELIAEPQTATV